MFLPGFELLPGEEALLLRLFPAVERRSVRVLGRPQPHLGRLPLLLGPRQLRLQPTLAVKRC